MDTLLKLGDKKWDSFLTSSHSLLVVVVILEPCGSCKDPPPKKRSDGAPILAATLGPCCGSCDDRRPPKSASRFGPFRPTKPAHVYMVALLSPMGFTTIMRWNFRLGPNSRRQREATGARRATTPSSIIISEREVVHKTGDSLGVRKQRRRRRQQHHILHSPSP